jgi:DNA-binding transcriptional regulator YiaG
MTPQELQTISLARELAANGAARVLRTRARLSLSEVASACATDPANVHRWELGRQRPSGRRAVLYGELLERLMGGRHV